MFSLLFDENMNHILQNEQLDIHIRFWDDSKCMAVTRYFESHFLRRHNADNIVTKLQQSLQKLVAEKIIQLSMMDLPQIGQCLKNCQIKERMTKYLV